MGVKVDGDYGTMHRILKILAWRYAKASELAEILGISRQAVYYHLQRLVEWGFVIRNTRECIMATLLIPEKELYLYYEEGCLPKLIKGEECEINKQGEYYVYVANYYIRKMFPDRPSHNRRDPPIIFIDIVKKRLRQLGVENKVRGYNLILMAAILNLMAAVLWNPKPRGNNYWDRLKHLTTKGIYKNIGKFIAWYVSMKSATEVKRRYPIRECAISKERCIAIKQQRYEEYHQLIDEYYDKYRPSPKKIRCILAKMYDFLMVERLGGDRCPYGVWVLHPSLFTPDGKLDFHLPRHHHVDAKHRYRTLRMKSSFTAQEEHDNHPK